MEQNKSRIAFFIAGILMLSLVVIALGSQLETLQQAITHFQMSRMIRM